MWNYLRRSFGIEADRSLHGWVGSTNFLVKPQPNNFSRLKRSLHYQKGRRPSILTTGIVIFSNFVSDIRIFCRSNISYDLFFFYLKLFISTICRFVFDHNLTYNIYYIKLTPRCFYDIFSFCGTNHLIFPFLVNIACHFLINY